VSGLSFLKLPVDLNQVPLSTGNSLVNCLTCLLSECKDKMNTF
ncbi:MAG: hypothetical protein ACI9QN_000991, partial [Arcticibacterium sp.]